MRTVGAVPVIGGNRSWLVTSQHGTTRLYPISQVWTRHAIYKLTYMVLRRRPSRVRSRVCDKFKFQSVGNRLYILGRSRLIKSSQVERHLSFELGPILKTRTPAKLTNFERILHVLFNLPCEDHKPKFTERVFRSIR